MTTYMTKDADYLDPEQVKIEYHIDHPCEAIKNRVANSFKYYEAPPMGLGERGELFIGLDEFIDTTNLDLVVKELNDNIDLARDYLTYMVPFGLVDKEVNGEKCLDSYLLNPSRYGVTLDNYSYAKNITNFHTLKHYFLGRFNLTQSWKRILHLRKPLPFYEKGNKTDWHPIMGYFPHLKFFIEQLPFEHMGIGLIFRSNEDAPLRIHRDSYLRNHSMHHINISLSTPNRRVFIYDPIEKKKHHLNSSVRCYTFNECDLHGAEPQFDHCVLRIDGKFQDWFANRIGLKNGVSFDWGYDKPQDFIKQNGGIRIWDDLDV